MKKVMAASAMAASVILSTAACSAGGASGKLHVDADYALYSSIEELAAESNGGFHVKMGKVVSRQCDDGGEAVEGGGEPTTSGEDTEGDPNPDPSGTPSPEPTFTEGMEGGQSQYDNCIPMVLQEATVESIIYTPPKARGVDPVPLAKLLVANVDTDAANVEGASALQPGSYVVLYLDDLVGAEHPGLNTAEDVWVPVGGEQGILDVDGTTVTARSESIKSLAAGNPTSRRASDKFTTTLSELKQFGSRV
ncbi:hypothetical protein [Streptomyces sp. NPDC018000]|uniref:hypothetical protein n=1 Tax=Streptomyces sp. NPDC018000 TaxID=3365028 RepID=UPI0037AAD6A6